MPINTGSGSERRGGDEAADGGHAPAGDHRGDRPARRRPRALRQHRREHRQDDAGREDRVAELQGLDDVPSERDGDGETEGTVERGERPRGDRPAPAPGETGKEVSHGDRARRQEDDVRGRLHGGDERDEHERGRGGRKRSRGRRPAGPGPARRAAAPCARQARSPRRRARRRPWRRRRGGRRGGLSPRPGTKGASRRRRFPTRCGRPTSTRRPKTSPGPMRGENGKVHASAGSPSRPDARESAKYRARRRGSRRP